eukprot:12913151-Heterocapsa_arctica.AAC.1
MNRSTGPCDNPLWDDQDEIIKILGPERLGGIFDEWHREVTHSLTCKLGRTLPKNLDAVTTENANTVFLWLFAQLRLIFKEHNAFKLPYVLDLMTRYE